MAGRGMREDSVREAGPNDAGLVADILGEAFSDDAMMGWIFGGEGCARPLFYDLARRLYLKEGFGHLIGDIAATLWLPARARASLTVLDQLVIGATTLRLRGPRALGRSKAVGDALAAHRPHTPHYYLFAVGVRGAAQGKGCGGRIIRAGLARADADAAPAYLENSKARNTPLYQRLGFEAAGDLPVPAGAPKLLPMLRPAMQEAA